MIQSQPTEPMLHERPTSRRRDWVLLPAVSLLTFCFMAVSAELLARWFYPVSQVGFQNCFTVGDPSGDAPVKPNSVCWEQTAESTLKAEYKFNSRGDRAGDELGPKAPGTFRIVLIGSSMTQGLFVPREKTFAALLPEELSTETGRKIEIYNEATGGKFRGGPYPTQGSVKHFDRVLAANPDLILWVITPTDISNAETRENEGSGESRSPKEELRSTQHSGESQNLWSKLTASILNGTFVERLQSRWDGTRTSVVLKHLLIASESQDEYVKSYLQNGENANFLKIEPDPQWQMQLKVFDAELGEMLDLAKDARVPVVAVLVPNRPQAAMLSHGSWPSGYDPFKLERELRESTVDHGGRFIDILGDYRRISSPERTYFPVDGHPDADGHAIIARLLARELTSGSVPELKPSVSSGIASEPLRQ